MKNKHLIIVGVVIVSLSLTITMLIWQYQSYNQTGKNIENFQWYLNPHNEYSDFTRYIYFANVPDDSKNYQDTFAITISPNLEHSIFATNESDRLKLFLTDENINAYRSRVRGTNISLTNEEIRKSIDGSVNDSSLLTLFVTDPSLKPRQKYTISISPKHFNIFNHFLGEPKKSITFVIKNAEDPNKPTYPEQYAEKFINSLLKSEFLEGNKKQQEAQSQACPFWTVNTDKFQSRKKEGTFETMAVRCSYFAQEDEDSNIGFTGEQITVEIYTPDFETGEQAFRDALAKDGFKESDKLRIVFVHKPKN